MPQVLKSGSKEERQDCVSWLGEARACPVAWGAMAQQGLKLEEKMGPGCGEP